MESDREVLKAMLDSAGVVWRTGDEDGEPNTVVVEAGTGENNVGYTGFISAAYFNEDGSLSKWGCWE